MMCIVERDIMYIVCIVCGEIEGHHGVYCCGIK